MQKIPGKCCALCGALLILLLSSSGCRKEKTTEKVISDYYERIRFVIENNADYDGYTNYMAAAGLLDTMAAPGPYTILLSGFYLSNLVGGAAVDSKIAWPLMRYQTMRGVKRLDTLPLKTNQPIPTMFGKDIYVSRYAIPGQTSGTDTVTAINGTEVTNGNIRVSNGMIHVLPHLLAPPQFSSLYDALLSQEDFRFMAVIVDRVNMRPLLQSEGPYTFFVPANSAFTNDPAMADLGIRTIDDIYKADTAVLGNLVRTHLLKGMMFKKDLMWQYFATGKHDYAALNGEAITLSNVSEWSVDIAAPGNVAPGQIYFGPDYVNPEEGFLTGNGVLIMLGNVLIPQQ